MSRSTKRFNPRKYKSLRGHTHFNIYIYIKWVGPRRDLYFLGINLFVDLLILNIFILSLDLQQKNLYIYIYIYSLPKISETYNLIGKEKWRSLTYHIHKHEEKCSHYFYIFYWQNLFVICYLHSSSLLFGCKNRKRSCVYIITRYANLFITVDRCQ